MLPVLSRVCQIRPRTGHRRPEPYTTDMLHTWDPANDGQKQADEKVFIEAPVLQEYCQGRQENGTDEQPDISNGDGHFTESSLAWDCDLSEKIGWFGNVASLYSRFNPTQRPSSRVAACHGGPTGDGALAD